VATFAERWRYRIRARFIGGLEVFGYLLCLAIAAAALFSWFYWTDVKKSARGTLAPTVENLDAETRLTIVHVHAANHAPVRAGDPILTANYAPGAILLARMRAAVVEAEASLDSDPNGSGEQELLASVNATLEAWERANSSNGPPPTVLAARSDGYVVISPAVKPGAIVEPGQALFKTADFSTAVVSAAVKPEDMAAIKVGQPAQGRLEALDGHLLSGTVTEVDSAAMKAQVRFAMDDPELQETLRDAYFEGDAAKLACVVQITVDRIRLFRSLFKRG
jgi:multidrug resistance efflux pump